MFFLHRPSEARIRAFLEQQQASIYSYSHVGASRDGVVPEGFSRDHNRIRLGAGGNTWIKAKEALRRWTMFDIPWVRLCSPDTPIEMGNTVAIAIQHFGFWSLNASRIVYLIDESRRFGFAYGTLKEHSESGEERFILEWNEDDSVNYDLFAFSRPNATLAWIALPLARNLQRQFAKQSMAAMVRATLDQ